jgi:hypothetical protein
VIKQNFRTKEKETGNPNPNTNPDKRTKNKKGVPAFGVFR